MSLRVQAAEAFAERLQAILTLPDPVQVIQAPPSLPARYPACALLVDTTDHWLADDFIPVDADGNPLVANAAIMGLPADWGRFDANTLIYNAGRSIMHCRLFVATRHPSQRADFEDRILALFLEDDLAPGRILFELHQPEVLGRKLPWKWPVAVLFPETDQLTRWSSEFAFDERQWSYISCDIEVDILIPRQAPQILNLVLEFDVAPTIQVDPVTGVVQDDGNGETVQIDQAGDISPYP
jgi:hypothetical protein